MSALEIREELAEVFPGDVAVHTGLSISYVMLGELCAACGEAEETGDWFSRALELDRALVEAHPADPRLRDNLCWSYQRMGALAAERGDRASYEAFCRERHTLALALLETDPDRKKALFNLCASHNCLFELSRSKEDWPAALEHASEQRRLGEELSRMEPGNFLYVRFMTSAFSSMATAYAGMEHERESLTMYHEYTTRLAPLALSRPRDELLLSQVGTGFVALANQALVLDEQAEAVEACRTLLELGTELGRLYPDIESPRRLKAIAHRMYTVVDPSPTAETLDHAREACELFRELCSSPGVLPADVLEFTNLLLNPDLGTYTPREAVRMLEAATAMIGSHASILMSQTRAHLELGELDLAFEYLERAEDRIGPGYPPLEPLRARCEAARAANSDKVTPLEASHVFEGEDR